MTAGPNVVWLMTDEQRRDSLGCYGSPWAVTPNIDALASEGTLFEWAATPAPLCMPARTSLLTGLYPTSTGIWSNRVTRADAPRLELLTTHFAAAGYRTATFGKTHHGAANDAFETDVPIVYGSRVSALDDVALGDQSPGGVVRYPPEPYPWLFAARFPGNAEETPAAEIVREATAWLDDLGACQPFLLRLSFNAPHTPVAPPAPFDTLIDPSDIALADADDPVEHAPGWEREHLWTASRGDRLSPDARRVMRGAYYGECAFIDTMVGRFLDGLRVRGLLDNTIVAFVSDHGTHLGDFGLVQKQTFYEPVVAVPFFFWAPGRIGSGVRVADPVETRCLLPTLLDLCGLDVPDTVADTSAAAALMGDAAIERRSVFSEFSFGHWGHDWPTLAPLPPSTHRQVMVRSGPWKLTARADPELHDFVLVNLDDDPRERRNRSGDSDVASVEADLVSQVATHLEEGAVPPVP